MNIYQINIYPKAPHFLLDHQCKVKAETKEDAEAMAKKIITDLGLPAYPETMFERSFLKAL